MKIVVTGATGFIGRQLVPLLEAGGAELLLVGRDHTRLADAFPGHLVCDYAGLSEKAQGFDLLVHLAVTNSDARLPAQAFRDTNVTLAVETLEQARHAGIPRFVNVSSVHALDPGDTSLYATSKRDAARLLAGAEGIDVLTLYLPAVHGDAWSGRLAFLNRLPVPVARVAFTLLSAFRPTLKVSRLAELVLGREPAQPDRDIVLADPQDDNPVYRVVSRLIDLAFALVVLGLFWWALALIFVAIRLQSPGPGFFAQPRVGRNGKMFTCYKFRTMREGTAHVATNLAPADAVTGIGRFLRRTKLDELPQAFNILRNEMGLVGPRPCLPQQVELVEARRRRGVLSLKPGITGLAQINGVDMSEPERLARWDARYAALRSVLLDLRIMFATAAGRGNGDRVTGPPDRATL